MAAMGEFSRLIAMSFALLLAGCQAAGPSQPVPASPESPTMPSLPAPGATSTPEFSYPAQLTFSDAWAMSFLPDERALITQRTGELLLVDLDAHTITPVDGAPDVHVSGQGGLGDVLVEPAEPGAGVRVYLSWAQAGADGTSGAVVAQARLDPDATSPELTDLTVLWRQQPTINGDGHFGHRLALSPDGQYLFITSGDRQAMEPAQDPRSDLGKIIRLDLATGDAQRWTLGHRNPLGLSFAPDGSLWSTEMGPEGGDELNLISQGSNYGWPEASNGSHYGGGDIPDHGAGDGFTAPVAFWNPSISPGSLLIYSGQAFPDWHGDALVGALSGRALLRVDLDGATGTPADIWPMENRIRVIAQDPRDGTLWLIEDGERGRLIHVTAS
ncbi:MAG: PQQ-dependent sugar dehydrogenase [Beutenbergiaceae bacterium]